MMGELRAKLRSDLEMYPDADSRVIVKDPITRRFYRFTAEQSSAIMLMDGKTDTAVIAEEVSKAHKTDVQETQLDEFIGKLRSLLLLDTTYCWTELENTAGKKRNPFKNLLSIKVKAFNPDKLLTILEKKLRFCFSPTFNIIVWCSVAVAAIISIVHANTLFLSMTSLLSLYSLPFIVIVILAVVTVHEFGHGLTLKHFGGKVDEMGFMLLYFLPAFYCNVSDAWKLNKRQRLLVSFAGGYIQLFIWALATVAWRILSPETLASQICVIIIVFSAIQTFFNFNPLIRLDGYYLLSDYVEIANLRPKAIEYLKNKFVSWVTGEPPEKKMESGARERRFLFWYGSIAAMFTVFLIAVMFYHIGSWTIERYKTWGILFTSVLFFLAVPVTKKENVKTSGKLFKGLIIRVKKTPLIYMAIVLGLLIVGLLPWQLKISENFTIVPSKTIIVTPQVTGHLKRIFVDQGSRVYAGQALAELENLELANEYEETRGELATHRASLDLLKAGSRPEEIERARKLVETKKMELHNTTRIDKERALLHDTIAKQDAELANARLNYERSQSLLQSGLIARIEADRDRTTYEVKQKEAAEARGRLSILEEQKVRNQDIKRKELAQAQSELNILLAGSRQESIRAAESQVIMLEEKSAILQRQLDLLTIRSPIDGFVASPHLKNRIGDFLDRGAMFCEVVSEGPFLIEMAVKEKEIGDIQIGYPITLKVRGYPRNSYEAHVRSIAPIAENSDSGRTIMVQGELKNQDDRLKAGMTGIAKILCGKRPIFEIASRSAIRWIRTEFWEYVP